MTTIKEHEKIVKEFIDDINEKIRINLVVERQKIIGFATSEASANLFALFLHKKNIIEPGFNINHRHFASEKIAKKIFNFDFPLKEELINLMVEQESYRNKLCYGKEKEANIVNSAIKNLFKIKQIIDSEIKENE